MLNKVILIGNLGADPELKHIPSGSAVCDMRIATERRWTSKDGTKQKATEWHRVVAWGKTAEICKEYLSKGRTVYVEGRIETKSWEDKEGNKRYTTQVVAEEVKFLGGGKGDGASKGGGTTADPNANQEQPAFDDDVPF